MATIHQNLSEYDESKLPSGEKMRIGIIVADWNPEVTYALYQGCYDTLIKHGLKEKNIRTFQVPGSFELVAGAKLMLNKWNYVHAVICLGCVIKGETSHNEYINHAVANGLIQLSLDKNVPCIFGVLTPNDQQQALDRAGGKHGNKGVEAAVTAIRMAALKNLPELNQYK